MTMLSLPSVSNQPAWTIADAKARLSEILRKANTSPQYIGTKKTYVLIPQETWQQLNQPKIPIGQWLVDNLQGLDELELPQRADPAREIPFQ